MGLAMPPQVNSVFRSIQTFLVVVLLGSVACVSGEPHIVIEEPEAKLSPVILGVASVFMKIVNSGNGGDRLLSARADIPGSITELHDEENGKMITVTDLDVPASSSLLLRPGGSHIMVFRIPRTMIAGTEFRIVMTFKYSGERTVSLKLTEYATKSRRSAYH